MTPAQPLRSALSVLSDALLSKRLGRRHFILFRDHPIAYGRIPKVANTSVKTALTRLLPNGDELRKDASPDRLWDVGTGGRTRMIRARDAVKLDGVFVFSFVRDPFERAASYYATKVAGAGALPRLAARDGLRKGMPFAEFLERVAEMDDRDMDDHLTPQAVILRHGDRLVPRFIGRQESMAEHWEDLRRELAAFGAPDLGPLPHRNRRAPEEGHDLAGYFADPGLIRLLRERYADDIALFYPDADPLRRRG